MLWNFPLIRLIRDFITHHEFKLPLFVSYGVAIFRFSSLDMFTLIGFVTLRGMNTFRCYTPSGL